MWGYCNYIDIIYLFFMVGFPIVINIDDKAVETYNNDRSMIEIPRDSVVNPLINMDFSEGYNQMFIVFDFADLYTELNALPPNICKRRVLYCTNNEVLQEFKNNFNLEISGGDMATVTTQFLCFKNKELVFYGDLDISSNSVGIQSSIYGWARIVNKNEIIEIVSRFKPYRGIVLNLNDIISKLLLSAKTYV